MVKQGINAITMLSYHTIDAENVPEIDCYNGTADTTLCVDSVVY